MRRPYKTPVITAFPNLKSLVPRISRFVIFLCGILGRFYLFLFYGIARIVLQNEMILFNSFKRALSGESRCILAFRHPNGGEPQLLAWFFLFRLKTLAARRGIRFVRPPHAIFVYSYEVVRWGGWAARFVMPNLGALPIHHSKMDSRGMNQIFNALVEGPYPLALAPEGQVSYSTDTVPRLEPGAIRIGLNAAFRLAEKGSNVPVEILPVSVYFRFGPWGRLTVEWLLRKIEKASGFSRRARRKLSFVERLAVCREHILAANEARYRLSGGESLSFGERLERVVNAALETAERMLGIKGEGDVNSRMYRVRQLCWDKIYLPDIDNLEGMSPVERGTLDLRAGEAWHIGRHQELVDFCCYFRGPLPSEDAAFHSRIEYVQNLWDFANRTMGGAYSDRVSIFPRRVVIQAAPAINLSERLPLYRQNRKAVVSETMVDLEKAYLDCIKEANLRE